MRAEALKLASKYKLGPVFTPPVVSKADGPSRHIDHWLSKRRNELGQEDRSIRRLTSITFSLRELAGSLGLVPPEDGNSEVKYYVGTLHASGRGFRRLTVHGLPLKKPPYGKISAINLDTGEIQWQITHGETPDEIRNSPVLKGLNIPRTGRPGIIGVLTTKTLVIAGEGGIFTNAAGQKGALLRAYNKATGTDAGAVYMPSGQTGSPMTYMLNGKQYIVVAIGGQAFREL